MFRSVLVPVKESWTTVNSSNYDRLAWNALFIFFITYSFIQTFEPYMDGKVSVYPNADRIAEYDSAYFDFAMNQFHRDVILVDVNANRVAINKRNPDVFILHQSDGRSYVY